MTIILFEPRKKTRQKNRAISFNSQQVEKSESALLRFLFVPIAFIVLRTPGTVNRLYNIAHSNETPNDITLYLQAIGDPAQGVVNALFFYFTSERIKHNYLLCFGDWWRCIKSFRLDGTETDLPQSAGR